MAFPTVADRNVQYPNRIELTEVSAGVYDVEAVPGSVVAEGTAIDSALFSSIDTATQVAVQTVAASAKTTPIDADSVPLVDSADSNALKKVTWANIKATLKTYCDTLYPTGGVGAWTAYTPAVTAATGAFTTASATGRWTQIGKVIHFKVSIIIANVGTGAGVRVALPITAHDATGVLGVSLNNRDGKLGTCFLISTSAVQVMRYDYVDFAATGAVINAVGTFEAA